jgi:general secretion pathway protein A
MEQTHWKLSDTPFQTTVDPHHFFAGSPHEEALARLHFLVDHRHRLGVLLGKRGIGKSMLLEVFLRQLRGQARLGLLVSVMGMDQAEFLWQVAAGLGLNPATALGPAILWRRILDCLTAHRYQRSPTVILIDDAEEAETEVLTALARLAQFELNQASPLTLVLSAEAARSNLLGRRLQELCELRIELEAWNAEETAEYIRRGLARTTGQVPLFQPEAIDRIHVLSAGLPRRVQQLAQLVLWAAVGQDLDEIDESMIDAVQRELSLSCHWTSP